MNGQFSTRVITLMPVAIAINIVLGVTVQQVLKLPIYLDSIGTILVGVLAGPLAGALTGILTNLIWQYAPGIGGGTIGPFAVVAGVIGLLAGLWGQIGVYRSRPASGWQLWGPALVCCRDHRATRLCESTATRSTTTPPSSFRGTPPRS